MTGRRDHRTRWTRTTLLLLAVSLLTLAAPGAIAAGGPPAARRASASSSDKVMVFAEENEPDSAVIGSAQAPYLNGLAATYGQATDMRAGYPTSCPSLAAYLLMTSGSRDGICDDKLPQAHHVSGDNVFQQVAAASKQWREYAESMPSNCHARNGSGGIYLVRHAPPPYYTTESQRCPEWDVPLGTTSSGSLPAAPRLRRVQYVAPLGLPDLSGSAGTAAVSAARASPAPAR